jgi:hypothetical protein
MSFHTLATGWALDLAFQRLGINRPRFCRLDSSASSLSLLNDSGKISVANQDAKT